MHRYPGLSLAAVMIAPPLIVGCAEHGVCDAAGVEWRDRVVTVSGEGVEEQGITVGELTGMHGVERETSREEDDRTETFVVQAVTLEGLLTELDIGVEVRSVRLRTADGYSVQVLPDVLQRSELIFAWERDGEPLPGESGPLRAFIPGEESRYWISDLAEIEISAVDEQSTSVSSLHFLETLVAETARRQTESGEEAVRTGDLLAGLPMGNEVSLAAADGFAKNEEYDVFIGECIELTGESAPAFLGADLPRGMHVRDLVWFTTGEAAVLCVGRAREVLGDLQVEGKTGTPLEEAADALDMLGAAEYILEMADGRTAKIPADDLGRGIVYMDEEGTAGTVFDGLPHGTAMQGALSLRVAE